MLESFIVGAVGSFICGYEAVPLIRGRGNLTNILWSTVAGVVALIGWVAFIAHASGVQ